MTSLLRHRSSKEQSAASTAPANTPKIVLSGWMRKQKAHLKTWNRRFFALSGSTLSYYDSEDISGVPRGVLEVASVHPLPSEPNGLLLHCKANNSTRRRDEKLICDTNVAYNAWFALLTRATTADQSPALNQQASSSSLTHASSTSTMDTSSNVSSNNSDVATNASSPISYRPNPIKMGYVHVHYASSGSSKNLSNNQPAAGDGVPAADADAWNRYFIKVEGDLLNCYADESQQHLYVSGMVRNVTLYEGRKYALAVGLNKGRTVVLCCDSMEEKTNWLLTLEGALKAAYSVIVQRRGSGGLKRASSHIYDLDLAPEDQETPSGLTGLEDENKLRGVQEHSDEGDDGDDVAAASAATEDGSEASGVWI